MGPIIQYHILWTFTHDWLRVITFLTFGHTKGPPRGGECNRYNVIHYIIFHIYIVLSQLTLACFQIFCSRECNTECNYVSKGDKYSFIVYLLNAKRII